LEESKKLKKIHTEPVCPRTFGIVSLFSLFESLIAVADGGFKGFFVCFWYTTPAACNNGTKMLTWFPKRPCFHLRQLSVAEDQWNASTLKERDEISFFFNPGEIHQILRSNLNIILLLKSLLTQFGIHQSLLKLLLAKEIFKPCFRFGIH
jgi:hypothetical protein